MRRILLPTLAAAVLGSACQDNQATTPAQAEEATSAQGPQTGVSATSADVTTLTLALEDATTRILPALEDKGLAQRLSRQLTTLSGALSAGRMAEARQHLANAREVLASAGEALGTDADLGAISLVLDQADTLLSGSAQ